MSRRSARTSPVSRSASAIRSPDRRPEPAQRRHPRRAGVEPALPRVDRASRARCRAGRGRGRATRGGRGASGRRRRGTRRAVGAVELVGDATRRDREHRRLGDARRRDAARRPRVASRAPEAPAARVAARRRRTPCAGPCRSTTARGAARSARRRPAPGRGGRARSRRSPSPRATGAGRCPRRDRSSRRAGSDRARRAPPGRRRRTSAHRTAAAGQAGTEPRRVGQQVERAQAGVDGRAGVDHDELVGAGVGRELVEVARRRGAASRPRCSASSSSRWRPCGDARTASACASVSSTPRSTKRATAGPPDRDEVLLRDVVGVGGDARSRRRSRTARPAAPTAGTRAGRWRPPARAPAARSATRTRTGSPSIAASCAPYSDEPST